ncbi:MAG: hypothetical protein ACR2FE_08730 [Aeromicrobium sp.]
MTAPLPKQSVADGRTRHVERFVRDVLLTVPGGPQRVASVATDVRMIRRAARRRGLTMTKVGKETYFYAGRIAVGGVTTSRMTSLVGRLGLHLCDNKHEMKELLAAAGLPTARGITVGSDEFDVAVAELPRLKTAVLKPTFGMRSRGVTCDIVSEDDLQAAWKTALRAPRNRRFLLEEQVDGLDLKVLVIGGRPVAAVTRLPAHIVGDGRLSIAGLVEAKAGRRRENALLAERSDLVLDPARLARRGRTPVDVPSAGEVVVLHELVSLRFGGENVDVTDLVHPDLTALAVHATRSLPGLAISSVDLIVQDLRTVGGAVIVEVNAAPALAIHRFPAYGTPRDVAQAVVDEMITRADLPRWWTWRQTRPIRLARRGTRAARARIAAAR